MTKRPSLRSIKGYIDGKYAGSVEAPNAKEALAKWARITDGKEPGYVDQSVTDQREPKDGGCWCGYQSMQCLSPWHCYKRQECEQKAEDEIELTSVTVWDGCG